MFKLVRSKLVRKSTAVTTVTLAAVALVVLIGLRPRLEAAGSAPLWTEKPPSVTALTEPAPAWAAIARALKPAVVNVSTKKTSPALDGTGFDDFFRPFAGTPHTVRGLGSGFVISPTGEIVTNNHVVDGASDVRVKMADGRELPAKVIGRDPKTDVALIKVDATNLPVVPLGDSAALQVGEPVMAIGNPFGLEQTVTTGIVSATGRVIGEGPYDDFIQTDAAINPGNSGGPLINAHGQAIGINTAIFSQTGGSVGVGFAIPVNLAKSVVTQLAASGHVVRGWLGVTIQPVTPALAKSFGLSDTSGALVASVADNSPAQRAGVQEGDVIVSYDGRHVGRSEDLPRVVADTPIGREVPLTIVRDGKKIMLRAVVAQLTDEDNVETAAARGRQPDRLGLTVQSITTQVARELGLDDTHGVLVRAVDDASRAADAGLRPGDVIVAVDRTPVKTVDDLNRLIAHKPSGVPTAFLVHRGHGSLFVAVRS